MNIAIIFAGGSGQRMKAKDRPKQFLVIHGKPIIVHTLEKFQSHKEIDAIVVSCIKSWINHLEQLKRDYNLDKVSCIAPGGETGQLSIYNALQAAAKMFGINNNIVLIHDAVRPIISHEIITNNIKAAKEYGNCITCSQTKETILILDKKGMHIPDRSNEITIKAPQTFYLKDILSLHEKAISEKFTSSTDSASLAYRYEEPLHLEYCQLDNIKITTQNDFYMVRGMFDAIELEQLEIPT